MQPNVNAEFRSLDSFGNTNVDLTVDQVFDEIGQRHERACSCKFNAKKQITNSECVFPNSDSALRCISCQFSADVRFDDVAHVANSILPNQDRTVIGTGVLS